MRRMLIFVLASLVFSACSGTATEAPPPSPTEPPAAAPTETPLTPVPPTATVTTVPPTATFTPLPPIPTSTPVPETPADSYNSDLDYAQVIFVEARQGDDGLWQFDTTVRHNDEGWDHYADAWQVVDSAGNILAERILAHPHDNEQPFTRSQSNIGIPPDVRTVTVRAKCNVHGFGGQEVVIDLSVSEGENFEVTRP